MSQASCLPPSGGLASKVLRASGLTLLGFGGSQLFRLLSNLVLTRLLLPEAFGMMTLVTLVLTGLKLFSDIGLAASILRSPRGDDQAFLDTAWSLDILRGLGLWLAAAILSWPLAFAYDLPLLKGLIPVTALVLILAALEPTRLDTAARHLQLGRVIPLDLTCQAIGLSLTACLAWITGSVWALACGQVLAAFLRLILLTIFLPGPWNRFRIELEALRELLSFGKWLFFSTMAAFAILQGDKLILSAWLSLEELGIYNIGYFLASVPVMMGVALVSKLMIPLYRDLPPQNSPANFAKLRRVRFTLSLATLLPAAILALYGREIVGLLYDPRYAMAGHIVVMLAVALMPHLVVQSYDQVALSAGASGLFCLVTVARGLIFLGAIWIGTVTSGLVGAILAQGIAPLLSYPLVAALARKFGAWDPLHDALSFTAILIFALVTHSLTFSL